MTANRKIWALNEDSDQPAQPPSLIKDFAVRKFKACFLSYTQLVHSEDSGLQELI